MSAGVLPLKGSAIYEAPDTVSEYLLFHYGDADDVLGVMPGPREAVGFAKRLVCELAASHPASSTALDMGCAVGATAFELSKSCESVLGVDFSQAFIHAAEKIRQTGSIRAAKRIEGHRTSNFTATLDQECHPERVTFEVGDACQIRADMGQFDLVVAANLICRLPDPQAFLARLPSLVRPGGQLILTTPFTWMEDYTPVENWLGATEETGDSFDVLCRELQGEFTLELRRDIPFLIREHSRKFQYTVAIGSRWRRR